MTNAFYHTGTSTTIQFPANPIRGNGDVIERRQVSGFDSSGNIYVYTRSSTQRRETTLVFTNVLAAVLDALLVFIQSRNGDKNSFTWYDHDAAAHTVRFTAGQASYKETTPDKFRVEVKVTEEL